MQFCLHRYGAQGCCNTMRMGLSMSIATACAALLLVWLPGHVLWGGHADLKDLAGRYRGSAISIGGELSSAGRSESRLTASRENRPIRFRLQAGLTAGSLEISVSRNLKFVKSGRKYQVTTELLVDGDLSFSTAVGRARSKRNGFTYRDIILINDGGIPTPAVVRGRVQFQGRTMFVTEKWRGVGALDFLHYLDRTGRKAEAKDEP
jgi:hypothetical protein